jgi:hypothetical protein
MKKICCFVALVLFVLVVTPHATPQADQAQQIAALRADLDLVRRDLDSVRRFGFTPSNMIDHVEWNPSDPQSVDRMRLALRDKYNNHGGLLRLTIDGQVVEVHSGVFVDFLPPQWTVVSTWPDLRKKK